MYRIRWVHVQYNLFILLVIVVAAYLFLFLLKDYSEPKYDFINKLQSMLWPTVISISKYYLHAECSECKGSTDSLPLVTSKELDAYQLGKFPFRTVEDAWTRDNRILSPFIQNGANPLLEPDFQVYLSTVSFNLFIIQKYFRVRCFLTSN